MVNSDELLGTTEYLTLYTWCRINRCRYSRARLCFLPVTLQYHLSYYFILTIIDKKSYIFILRRLSIFLYYFNKNLMFFSKFIKRSNYLHFYYVFSKILHIEYLKNT